MTTEPLPPLVHPMSDAERILLGHLLRWARDHGWRRLPGRRGHYLSADRRFSVQLADSCLFVTRPGREAGIISMGRVAEMIAVLAELRVVPAGFSLLAHHTLCQFATYCEQRAVQLTMMTSQAGHPDDAVVAAGWFAAAAAARTYGWADS